MSSPPATSVGLRRLFCSPSSALFRPLRRTAEEADERLRPGCVAAFSIPAEDATLGEAVVVVVGVAPAAVVVVTAMGFAVVVVSCVGSRQHSWDWQVWPAHELWAFPESNTLFVGKDLLLWYLHV